MKPIKCLKLATLYLFLNLYSYQVFATANDSFIGRIDNLRLAIDSSVRGNYNFRSNHLSNTNSLGFDLHKVFTQSDGGDIATLIAQGYWTKLVNAEQFPAFFKNKNDTKFICRICNLNVIALDRGVLNFRIGHYEIPFGLEHNIDTNGTLKQYSNARDLGGKLDWGVTANGKFSWGAYEISLSRGAGVEWTKDYDTYIVSGRVEKEFGYTNFLGFSAFHGHLRPSKNSTFIDKTRIGLDTRIQTGLLTWLTEFSIGKNGSTELINSLFEVDITNNTEKLMAYFQFKTTSHRLKYQGWDSILQSSLGLKYSPDNLWTISSQWTHDIEQYKSKKQASVLTLQLRLRF